MDTANVVNSVGLACDVVGAVLLAIFGVARLIDTGGQNIVVAGQIPEDEEAKIRSHNFWSKVGLVLLAFGFLLQFLSNTIPLPAYWS